MIEHLCLRHHIALLTFSTEKDSPDSLRTLEDLCQVTRTVHKDVFQLERKKRVANMFSLTPSWFLHTDSDTMRSYIREVVDRHAPDIVQVEFLAMAHYIDSIRHPFVVLNTYEAFGRAWAHKALEDWRNPLAPYLLWDHWKLARSEKKLLHRFQAVLTFSNEDRRYFLSKNPEAPLILWIPGVTLSGTFRSQRAHGQKGDHLLFVGSFLHPPNVDGIRFFCKKILPKIIQEKEQVVLDIVGPHPPSSVQALQGRHVIVHGYVDNLAPFYQKADVVVVPVRFRGGLRTKLIEAMGHGAPTVTTISSAEGIDGMDGEHLFMTGSPEEFADRVIQLLSDPMLRQKMGRKARELVEKKYSWPLAIERLEAVYEDVLRKRTNPTGNEVPRSDAW